MPLEILHGALVLFGRRPRFEGTEIAPLAGFGIQLSGIEPVFAGLQFADHERTSQDVIYTLIAIPPMGSFRTNNVESSGDTRSKGW
jgi:hypothetical protein